MELNKPREEKLISISIVLKHAFHTLSLSLLSLLLPLSFLLLVRFSSTSPSSSSVLVSFTLHASSVLLQTIVVFVSVSNVVHGLMGHVPRPSLIVSWSILCAFQASVSLGIEAIIATGIHLVNSTSIGRVTWIQRAIFFVGIYEATLIWVKMLVKPVADDTLFGVATDETTIDRAAVGFAFGILWLWMLQNEIEPMVLAVEGLFLDAEWSGFVLWLIGSVTTITGMVKIIYGAVWLMEKLSFFQSEDAEEDSFSPDLVYSEV